MPLQVLRLAAKRPAAGASDPHPAGAAGQVRPDRPGVRHHAGARARRAAVGSDPARHLSRRHLRLRHPDRQAGCGRAAAAPSHRRSGRAVDGRPVRHRARRRTGFASTGSTAPTGAASLFATLDNSGPGLGDVVYDPATRQFFASDLDTGLIHRIDANGTVIDSFDHGLAGRPVQRPAARGRRRRGAGHHQPGLQRSRTPRPGASPRPRAWSTAWRCSPAGSTTRSPRARRSGRSASAPDGAFADDPRVELDVPNVPPGALITDLAFDGQGRLLRRAARRAARQLRRCGVRREERDRRQAFPARVPDDPATPGTGRRCRTTTRSAFPTRSATPPAASRSAMIMTPSGAIKRSACGGFLWSTGDNLRNNPAYAAQLIAGGALDVHGLQGNSTSLVRPQNQPPLASYFADYDGTFGDPEHVGHVGDVEIWQVCGTTTGQATQPAQPGTFGIIEQPVFEGGIPLISCPPGFSFVGGGCAPPPLLCDPGWTPAPPPVFCCPPGHPWTGKSCGHPHPCPPGWTKAPPPAFCCPPGKPWNGKSCGFIPHPCPPGWSKAPPPVFCCPPGKPWTGKSCGFIPHPCPPGWSKAPPPVNCCPPGKPWNGKSCGSHPASLPARLEQGPAAGQLLPARQAVERQVLRVWTDAPLPAWLDRHTAELPQADHPEALPSGHGRDTAELSQADRHQVPARDDRHTAKLPQADRHQVPARYGRHTAELPQADRAEAVPAWNDRQVPELSQAGRHPLPARDDRQVSELPQAGRNPLPAGDNREAAALPADRLWSEAGRRPPEAVRPRPDLRQPWPGDRRPARHPAWSAAQAGPMAAAAVTDALRP